MPATAKSSPECVRIRSKGEASAVASLTVPPPTGANSWPGPSNARKIASGLRNTSAGPTKPRIDRCMARTAASVLIAAEAPLESDS